MQAEGLDKVGVIGQGIIGSRVAESLRNAGRHVYVWNRTPKPIPNFVGSPSEMARLVDVLQIFVSDGEALLQVMDGMKDQLEARHVVIACGTSDPGSVVDAYQIARERGASFLDAPFTGSRGAAGEGTLVYYVGGDPKVLERVRPILEVSSKAILPMGRVGEASLIKIATNMISAATTEVLAEAYGLVTKAGVDPKRFAAALEHNACQSGLTAMKLPMILEGNYEPHFSLKLMFKDAQYALNLGKQLGVDEPVLSAAASAMYRAMQKGFGELDYSVVAERFQDAPVGPDPAASA